MNPSVDRDAVLVPANGHSAAKSEIFLKHTRTKRRSMTSEKPSSTVPVEIMKWSAFGVVALILLTGLALIISGCDTASGEADWRFTPWSASRR